MGPSVTGSPDQAVEVQSLGWSMARRPRKGLGHGK